jgi:hypothetical protein
MSPPIERALAGGAAQGSRGQDTDDDAIVGHHADEGKLLATVQAEGALRGLRVERVLGMRGGVQFIVIRGGRVVDCCDLDAVRLAVRRLGGAP